MKKSFLFFVAIFTFLFTANTYADFRLTENLEGKTIQWSEITLEGTCDAEFKVAVKNSKSETIFPTKIEKYSEVKCENNKFSKNLNLSKAEDSEKLTISLFEKNSDTSFIDINVTFNLGWWAPTTESLTLKRDCRVLVNWEDFENCKKENSINEENKNSENNKENNSENSSKDKNPKNKNSKNDSKDDDRVIIILENGNKFSHKKMLCGLSKEVQDNLTKDLTTNFNDIENLTFTKDIKNLENVKVVVWTSKNTFENREITKSELLGMALKANCYDVSGLNWQETVKKIWLENGIISDKNFSVNEKITKNEAFDIILKAGQIVTPKDSTEEAIKFLWVINDKNITSENLFREQAINILVNILKLYK